MIDLKSVMKITGKSDSWTMVVIVWIMNEACS